MKQPDLALQILNSDKIDPGLHLIEKETDINILEYKLNNAVACQLSCSPDKLVYWGEKVKRYKHELEQLKRTEVKVEIVDTTKSPQLTGSKVNYYLVQIPYPQREEQPPYRAECEDIIQALGMTFDEGCLFKALWRSAAGRLGNGKPGQKVIYDAEKMVHYAERILNKAKHEEP
ncbi:MAG: hypothetical protein [Bacteriophage sp.]|nr:MAG: hypothetical protein [Bacteriophage sp.]